VGQLVDITPSDILNVRLKSRCSVLWCRGSSTMCQNDDNI